MVEPNEIFIKEVCTRFGLAYYYESEYLSRGLYICTYLLISIYGNNSDFEGPQLPGKERLIEVDV